VENVLGMYQGICDVDTSQLPEISHVIDQYDIATKQTFGKVVDPLKSRVVNDDYARQRVGIFT
jgi:hypothetical protein